jgi:hypothetical protein
MTKSILELQSYILEYVLDSPGRNEPLIFRKNYLGDGPILELKKKQTLYDTVKQVLELAYNNASVNSKTKRMETSAGRLRSSFDIWRHVKSVKPDVSILEVMETLFTMKKILYFHYCGTVRRGVFRLLRREELANERMVKLAETRKMSAREYQNRFSEWKKLRYVDPKKNLTEGDIEEDRGG